MRGLGVEEPAAVAAEQLDRFLIVVLHKRHEPAHALFPRAPRQIGQQRAAQPLSLPVIDYRECDLSRLRVLAGTYVTRDPERIPAARLDRETLLENSHSWA